MTIHEVDKILETEGRELENLPVNEKVDIALNCIRGIEDRLRDIEAEVEEGASE